MPGCKPGDTAIIFRTEAGLLRVPPPLLGRPVMVRAVKTITDLVDGLRYTVCYIDPFSVVLDHGMIDNQGRSTPAGKSLTVQSLPDACLLPIRPSDAPDETLAWKAVPKPARATSPAANDPSYAP